MTEQQNEHNALILDKNQYDLLRGLSNDTPEEQEERADEDQGWLSSTWNTTKAAAGITYDAVMGAPSIVAGGALDAVDDIGHLAEDIYDWASDNPIEKKSEKDYFFQLGSLIATDNDTEKVGRDIVSFALGFVGVGKFGAPVKAALQAGKAGKAGIALAGGGAASIMARGAAKGAVADAVFVDPHDPRFADLIKEDSIFFNSFVDYLQSDENDSVFEARFKNTLEGIALGTLIEGTFKIVGPAYRKARALKKQSRDAEAEKAMKEAEDTVKSLMDAHKDVKEAIKNNESVTFKKSAIKVRGIKTKNNNIECDAKLLEHLTDAEAEKLIVTVFNGTIEPFKKSPNIYILKESIGHKDLRITLKKKSNGFVVKKIEDTEKQINIPGSNLRELNKAIDTDAIKTVLKDPDKLLHTPAGSLTHRSLFNIDRMQSEKDILDTLQQASSLVNDSGLPQKKTFAEMRDQGQDFVNNVLELDNKGLKSVLSNLMSDYRQHSAIVVGGKMLLQDVATQMRQIADSLVHAHQVGAETRDLETALTKYLRFNSTLSSAVKRVQTNAAQVTASGNIHTNPHSIKRTKPKKAQTIDTNADKVHKLGLEEGQHTSDQLLECASFIRHMGRDEDILKFQNLSTAFKVGKTVAHCFKSSILSSPPTHAVNITASGFNSLLINWNEMIGATLSPKNWRHARVAQRNFVEFFLHLGAASRMVKESLRHGDNLLDTTGVAKDLQQTKSPISASFWGLDQEKLLGKSIDKTGKFLDSFSFRLLGAGDEFWKQLNYRSRLSANAYVDSIELIKQGKLPKKYQKAYIKKRLDETLSDFKATDGTMIQNARGTDADALEFAREATFSKRSENSFVKFIESGLSKFPIGQLIVPFVTTPTNVIVQTAKNIPVVNILPLMKDLRSSSTAVRSRAMGRITTSMLFGSAVLYMCSNGMVTGGPPKDRRLFAHLRRSGWRPYSIRIGDHYYDYRRMEPLGQAMGIMADAYQIWEARSDNDPTTDRKITDVFIMAWASFSENIKNRTFFAGISNFISAADDPTTKSSVRFAANLFNGILPLSSLRRHLTRQQSEVYKEANTLLEFMAQDTPGLSSTIPTKFDWLTGQPIIRDRRLRPVLFSPYAYSKQKDGLVENELAKLRHIPDKPSKNLFLNKTRIKLTSDQYSRMCELMGTLKISGSTLYQALNGYFKSHAYRQFDQLSETQKMQFKLSSEGPDPREKTVIRLRRQYLEAAKRKLLDEFPELLEAARKNNPQ